MSFILRPKNGGSDLQINAWNWRPTLALLHQAKLIDDEKFDLMGLQGCGGYVDAESAHRIADFIDAKLQAMRPDERVRYDLSVTDAPKPKAVFTPAEETHIDANELYSAKYGWLIEFEDFARNSEGFEVL